MAHKSLVKTLDLLDIVWSFMAFPTSVLTFSCSFARFQLDFMFSFLHVIQPVLLHFEDISF